MPHNLRAMVTYRSAPPQGNAAFKKGDFTGAIKHYVAANEIEPEVPHYQLNLAAAHLKLNQWVLVHSSFSTPADFTAILPYRHVGGSKPRQRVTRR